MALPSLQSAPWEHIGMDSRCDVVRVVDSATKTDVVCELTGPYAVARAALLSAAPEMAGLIHRCRDFIAGFEDDETQPGVARLLSEIDETMLKASNQL